MIMYWQWMSKMYEKEGIGEILSKTEDEVRVIFAFSGV